MQIVFNGEIYNYRELREFLEKHGHSFRTNSDTEAILHLFEEFGTDCIQHLDGIFAFAIWNEKKQELRYWHVTEWASSPCTTPTCPIFN